jgi:hypothetical protein
VGLQLRRCPAEESLERVGVSRFDVLHMHDPDDHLEQAATTGYRALRDLRADGMVTAIGAGANRSAPLAVSCRSTPRCNLRCSGRAEDRPVEFHRDPDMGRLAVDADAGRPGLTRSG